MSASDWSGIDERMGVISRDKKRRVCEKTVRSRRYREIEAMGDAIDTAAERHRERGFIRNESLGNYEERRSVGEKDLECFTRNSTRRQPNKKHRRICKDTRNVASITIQLIL